MEQYTLMSALENGVSVLIGPREAVAALRHCEQLGLRWASGKMPSEYILNNGRPFILSLDTNGRVLCSILPYSYKVVCYHELLDYQNGMVFRY